MARRDVKPDNVILSQLVGDSAPLRALRAAAAKISATDYDCYLSGSTGTGKSTLARVIHELSGRAEGPFVVVPPLPESLLEAELFGCEEGAGTGVSERAGYIETANGGTLFLDEVGDFPPRAQLLLLRFLQERVYTRVGSTEERRSNVRVIAATWRDLEAEVRAGRFREDLYYRLNVLHAHMPSLAERREDVAALAADMLARWGAELELGADALAALSAHAWPGNLRELENALKRLLAAGVGRVRAEDVRVVIGDPSRGSPDPSRGSPDPSRGSEPTTTHEGVIAALAGHTQRDLAENVGMHLSWVQRRLKPDGPTARELEAVDRLLRARGLRLAIVPAEEDPS